MNGEQWQKEADQLAMQLESTVLKIVRPRILIDRKAGALIRSRPFRTIYIPIELRDCPADVRQYILLHEMGHLRYLHAYSLLPFLYLFVGALIDLPPYSFMDSQAAELLVRLLFALFVVFALAYAGFLFPPYFEGAADDHAVKLMGKERVSNAMRWIIWKTGKLGNARAQQWRLDRLG